MSNEERLRTEIGHFRERFQALSTILQDLQGMREPAAVLRSAQAVVASTVGSEMVWLLDGRGAALKPMVRSREVFPTTLHGDVRRCLRIGRVMTVGSGESEIILVPLQSGAVRWGVMAVRANERRAMDSEQLRFLSLAASLLGASGGLWEARTSKGHDVGTLEQNWMSLGALPSRCLLLWGEQGTGKRTFAERLHERYVGGGFASVKLNGSDGDEPAVSAILKRPGIRSLYVFDAVLASPTAREALFAALESNPSLVLFLGTSEAVLPLYPDALISGGALVTIRLTALRERGAGVPALVQAGLTERGLSVRLSSAAKRLLSTHAWPGNYDELVKFVRQAEQALRLEQGSVLGGQLTRRLLADADWISLPKLVDKLEAQIIAEALRRFDGNHAAAARVLKMTPRQITYKCEKYGLE